LKRNTLPTACQFCQAALELSHHCAATAAVARESDGPEAALWPNLEVHMRYMFNIKYGVYICIDTWTWACMAIKIYICIVIYVHIYAFIYLYMGAYRYIHISQLYGYTYIFM
jgi:hypothetical protein